MDTKYAKDEDQVIHRKALLAFTRFVSFSATNGRLIWYETGVPREQTLGR
jgi:hypothetical protein